MQAVKIRYIFIFYRAHNHLYIRHPWIQMLRKSVTLLRENKCNSNKYRRKKHPNGEKKTREHLAQPTKSEIRYRIVTSFKQMAMTNFPFFFSWNWQRNKLRSLPIFADGICPAHVLWLISSERLERSFLIRSAVDTRESYIESLILSTIFSSFFLDSVKQKALPGNLL